MRFSQKQVPLILQLWSSSTLEDLLLHLHLRSNLDHAQDLPSRQSSAGPILSLSEGCLAGQKWSKSQNQPGRFRPAVELLDEQLDRSLLRGSCSWSTSET